MKTNKQINGTIRCKCDYTCVRLCARCTLCTRTSQPHHFMFRRFVFDQVCAYCVCVCVFRRREKAGEKRKMLSTESRKTSRIEKGQTISMPTSLSAKFSLFFCCCRANRGTNEKRREGNYGTSLEDSKNKLDDMKGKQNFYA